MIVPMKKVSLLLLGDRKAETLKALRKLGILQIEIYEGTSARVPQLQAQIAQLEQAMVILGKAKAEGPPLSSEEALVAAQQVLSLSEEKARCQTEQAVLTAELERLADWGPLDPRLLTELAEDGIHADLYELPKAVFAQLGDEISALRLDTGKATVKCLLLRTGAEGEDEQLSNLEGYRLVLPTCSTDELQQRRAALAGRVEAIDGELAGFAASLSSMRSAVLAFQKEIEFEICATGMDDAQLSAPEGKAVSVSYFQGYLEEENLDRLKQAARDNAWGLLVEDPTPEDHVPTKLKNNRFISLIYPLTDFMGTVPGYFEFDISGWFLAFILVFFGIIFGDGAYGLVICAAVGIYLLKTRSAGKPVPPAAWLILLFGLSTILWGTLTCTWCGLDAAQLPGWLKALSVPVISNVYADQLWYPFWTHGAAGLTVSQNVQIVCFSLALVQLTVAHVMCAVRDRGSLKILGDLGSILQLFGIFYLVLNLLVDSEVFSFALTIGGIPINMLAIALIGAGFLLSFVFSNYEGSVAASIRASLTNIVSVLLGVVNVFSDIVSYIRLWAVGLAGSAIAATINTMAAPLLGSFLLMIFAIVLLVFGHGLNMILNVLSVIVHGIRLNTLEFSSHLDMSWSGYKFKPFRE